MPTTTTNLQLLKPLTSEHADIAVLNTNFDTIDANLRKNNFTATTPPTVFDDAAHGYMVGSKWVNTTTQTEYYCYDATAGAAVWNSAKMVPGTSGQSLISDGTTPVWSDAGGYASMSRQAIIDGNFQIAQVGAGAAVTNPAHGTYPVFDLWKNNWAADGGTPPTIIHSQAALTPGELDGSFYAYKIAVNGAGSSFGADSSNIVLHAIEHGTRSLCGLNKKVTLSFWAKSTIAGKRLGIFLQQYYGVAGSSSASELINGTNYTLNSTWTKYTYTFTTNTLVGKTFGASNDDFLKVGFFLQWGSSKQAIVGASTAESWVGSGDIYIAQVQLCSGDVALPFEPKSFADELEACQRYYRKSYKYYHPVGTATYEGEVVFPLLITLAASTAGSVEGFIRFEPAMRTAPTFIIYARNGAINTAYATRAGVYRAGATIQAAFSSEKGVSTLLFDNTSAQAISATNAIAFQYVADARF